MDWMVLWDAILALYVHAFEVTLEWCYYGMDD